MNNTTIKQFRLVYSIVLGCKSAHDYGYHNLQISDYISDGDLIIELENHINESDLKRSYDYNNEFKGFNNYLSALNKLKELVIQLSKEDYSYLTNDNEDIFVFVGVLDTITNKIISSKSFNIDNEIILTNLNIRIIGLFQ